ncbi:unnamed protein product [Closterium sp. Yama58-4]|nr:unnamed protein product [Closterium sp. Yama58-4]
MPIVENDPCETSCCADRAAAGLSDEGKLGDISAASAENPSKTPRQSSYGPCGYPVSSLLTQRSNPVMMTKMTRGGFQLITAAAAGGYAPPEAERRVGDAANPRFDASMNDLESDPRQNLGLGSRNPVVLFPSLQNVLAQPRLTAPSAQVGAAGEAGASTASAWCAPRTQQQLVPPPLDAPRSGNPLLSRATQAAGTCARFLPVAAPPQSTCAVAAPQSTCAQRPPVTTGAAAPQFPSLFSGASQADVTPPPTASLLSLNSSRVVAVAAGRLFLNSHGNAVEQQQEHQEQWLSRQHNKRTLDLNNLLSDEVEAKRHCDTQRCAADSAASGGSGGAKQFAWNATAGATPAVAGPSTPAIAATYNVAPSTPAFAASWNAAPSHAGSPGSIGVVADSAVSSNGSLSKGDEAQPFLGKISPTIFGSPQSVQRRVCKVQKARVCGVCNKSFSSGQALGGHMRKHLQGEKADSSLKKLLLETKPGDGVEQASKTRKKNRDVGIGKLTELARKGDASDEGGNLSPPCTQQGGWEGSSNRPHQVEHHSILDNSKPHLVVHHKPLEKDGSRERMFAEACAAAVLDRQAAPAPFFPSHDGLDLDLRL